MLTAQAARKMAADHARARQLAFDAILDACLQGSTHTVVSLGETTESVAREVISQLELRDFGVTKDGAALRIDWSGS